MNCLEKKIRQMAVEQAEKNALHGDEFTLDYQTLLAEIETTISGLNLIGDSVNNQAQQSFAVLMDNHPAWAVLDLALLFSQRCSIALPKFFSAEQLHHALLDSQADYLIFDDELNELLSNTLQDIILSRTTIVIAQKKLTLCCLKKYSSDKLLSHNAAKITYTSGTTDQPKGVILSEQSILAKVISLAAATGASETDRSLSILPLSTLLENIGGLYVPLLQGGAVTLLSPQRIGSSGSSQINAEQLMSTINAIKPTAFIIIPQLLLMFIKLLSSGYKLPDSIRFIAMGGAPVSLKLLALAQQLNIPVFEGYGLSEAASVVAVNNPQAHKIGSVGQVLNTHSIKIISDKKNKEGEIFIKGALFNGYLGGKAIDPHEFYATGDIGKLDSDGFLTITGRKKNIINTSYGRNISPEWIEKELEAIPDIAQSVIVGHAKPYLIAIIVLRNPHCSKAELSKLLNTLNEKLPDYARVMDFIISDRPFTIKNTQLTGTGRPRRNEIQRHFQQQIEALYSRTDEKINGEDL